MQGRGLELRCCGYCSLAGFSCRTVVMPDGQDRTKHGTDLARSQRILGQVEFNQVEDPWIDFDRTLASMLVDRHQIIDAGVFMVDIIKLVQLQEVGFGKACQAIEFFLAVRIGDQGDHRIEARREGAGVFDRRRRRSRARACCCSLALAGGRLGMGIAGAGRVNPAARQDHGHGQDENEQHVTGQEKTGVFFHNNQHHRGSHAFCRKRTRGCCSHPLV